MLNAFAGAPPSSETLSGEDAATEIGPERPDTEATLEALVDNPQHNSQTSRRDSIAMGLVISDSISLQGSLNLRMKQLI